MTTEAPSLLHTHGRRLSGRTLAARAAAVGLWLLVFSSAASGLLALARVQAGGHAASAAPASPGEVGGLAELYVAAYLEDPASAVEAFYPGGPQADPGVKGARLVQRAASVRLDATGKDAWTVTVGAEVLAAAEGGYRRDGLHFYEVAIARTPDGYAAGGLPVEVQGPDRSR